jgi:YD repeat-containing protein
VGRVIAVTCPDAPSLDETYTFDASGNIIEKTVGGKSVAMRYDLANQLLNKVDAEGETTGFEYDDAGRLIGECVNGTNVASYTYGYLDKVMQVTRDGKSAAFSYDASGMLVGKEKAGSTEGNARPASDFGMDLPWRLVVKICS